MALKLYSKARKRRASPEACLQMTVCEYLRLAGVPGLLWFSVPNEQRCSVQRGAQLKRMGRLPGVSDLIIMIPRGDDHLILFLELKAKGGKQSQEQAEFEKAAGNFGFYACVDSIDDAISILEGYGAIKHFARRRAASPFAREAEAA